MKFVSLLSEEEVLAITFAADSSGPKDAETMEQIFAWVQRTLFEAEIIQLTVEGKIMLDWDPLRRVVRYKMTEAAYRHRPDA